ncbi:putative stigma-specific protein Stig1 [Septoria linicola]|nr:putative stigma-specific protein Stig1 [Septoria linicola]
MKAGSLAVGVLSLFYVGVAATYNECSSGTYKTLVPSLVKDRQARDFCASLPPAHRLDRNKCPTALKQHKYSTIKTACSCVKQTCNKQPTCYNPESSCRKASGCGGFCADLKKDKENCGQCGNKCTGDKKCIKGKCQKPQPTCPSNKKLCYGNCVDCQSDVNNCGGCGTKCGYGQKCLQGRCKTPQPTCLGSKTLCYGNCVDSKTDDMNCGGCGNKCSYGKKCIGGKCKTPEPTCYLYEQSCYGACANVKTDVNNCGACGTKQVCKNGLCQAPIVTPECTKDENCKDGKVCKDGKCQAPVVIPECTKDENCRDGKVCKDGKCEAPVVIPECTTNENCSDGKNVPPTPIVPTANSADLASVSQSVPPTLTVPMANSASLASVSQSVPSILIVLVAISASLANVNHNAIPAQNVPTASAEWENARFRGHARRTPNAIERISATLELAVHHRCVWQPSGESPS